ncbi:MAG: hypothetical protein ACRCW7_07285 [Cetobacterium sp.]
MAEELLVSKNNKKIFTFGVTDAGKRASVEGEVDIVIRSGSKESFDIVQYIDELERKSYTDISGISWHGFYQKVQSEIKMPLIKLKRKAEEEIEIDQIRHKVAIGRNTPYFTMICSLYVPKIKEFKECKNITPNNRKTKSVFDIDNETTRLDFFILPKFIDLVKFMNTVVGMLYYFGDITTFDPTKNGDFKTIMTKNLEYKTFKLGEWSILVKEVVEENMKKREPELANKFSLLLHYPNQYEYVFNRSFAYPNQKPMTLGEKFGEDYYGFSIRKSFETPVDRYKQKLEKKIFGDIYPYLLIGAYKKKVN